MILANMKSVPTLIYSLEKQVGLNPELSDCSGCIHVEYIYFTGVVCHIGTPEVTADGRCLHRAGGIANTTDGLNETCQAQR